MLTDDAQRLALGHLLNSRLKVEDAPAAAEAHFCAAVVMLADTLPTEARDPEEEGLIDYARQVAKGGA